MPRMESKEFRIAVSGTGGWDTIAYGQSDTFNIENSEVDATSKDSGGWSEVFVPGTIKTATLEGVFHFAQDEDGHTDIATIALSDTPVITARIKDGDSSLAFTGQWMITSFSLEGGAPEGFVSANISLRNVGPIATAGLD